jgi:hypothetical protein
VFHGESDIAELGQFFDDLMARQPVRFDPSKYPVFDDFVNDVFK